MHKTKTFLKAAAICLAASFGAALMAQGVASAGIAAQIKKGEKRNLQFGQLKWRVLEVKGGRALLITEDVVELGRVYHGTETNVTWAACDLRGYLNGEFLQKNFTPDEQKQILETKIQNPNNPQYGTSGGPDTNDKIFLLSIQEARAYFKSDKDRIDGVSQYQYEGKMYSRWWLLRSPGYTSIQAASINIDGSISITGSFVSFKDYVDAHDRGGHRPALFINLS